MLQSSRLVILHPTGDACATWHCVRVTLHLVTAQDFLEEILQPEVASDFVY